MRMLRLLVDRERRRRRADDGAVADPQVKRSGLDHELPLLVVEAEVLATQREPDRLRLSRRQRHAPEALELLHGLQDARVVLVEVELNDIVAGDGPRVGDVGTDRQWTVSR